MNSEEYEISSLNLYTYLYELPVHFLQHLQLFLLWNNSFINITDDYIKK